VGELLVDSGNRGELSAAALGCARERSFPAAADLYVEALGLS
jgi:hypothetical protein